MKGIIVAVICFMTYGAAAYCEPVRNMGNGGVSQDRAYRDIQERIRKSDAINEKDARINRYRGEPVGEQDIRRLERERSDIIRR